jgi:hypothetical protein
MNAGMKFGIPNSKFQISHFKSGIRNPESGIWNLESGIHRMSCQFPVVFPTMHGPTDDKPAKTFDASLASAIEGHLRSRELYRAGGILLRLIFGLPALLVGPIILSSIYWLIAIQWDLYIPWTWVFQGSIILLVPLLFWTEWRHGGTYYGDSIRWAHPTPDDMPTPAPLTGIGDIDFVIAFARNPRDVGITLVELFLWGPRQLLEAVVAARGMWQLRASDRHQAAELLRTLQTRDRAEINELIPQNNIPAGAAVAYLVWYDWIGVSADAQRVWIESESREILKR